MTSATGRIGVTLVAVFIAVLATAGQGARAADEPAVNLAGRIIRQIDLDIPAGAGGMTVARVREAIRLREGDAYDVELARADVAAIFALGVFYDVRAEALPLRDGVRLVFHLRMQPKVSAVRFTGNLGFEQETLEGLIQARQGAVAAPYVLKADVEVLRSHYRDAGYLFADVRQQSSETAAGLEVTYVIEAGPKMTMEGIRFIGNTDIPDVELGAVMVSVRQGGMFSRGRYEPSLLRSDLLAIRELVRRKGYLDATVGHEVVLDDAKERAWLTIRIEQGRLYTVSRLDIRGTSALSAAELAGMIATREGSPFALEQIDKDIRTIRDAYGHKGYIRADVNLERQFDAKTPTVAVVLTVDEGKQQHVGRVIIRGNRITQDHVVRRQVTLFPGEVVDSAEIDESKRRLMNTGLFVPGETAGAEPAVNIRFVDTADPALTDVVVEVHEAGRGNFAVGASYGSNLGFFGDFSVTLRNFDATNFPTSWRQLARGEAFTGNAEELGISLQMGTQYTNFSLRWRNPSLWDGPYAAGFEVYNTTYQWAGFYDDTRLGFAPTVSRRFGRDLTVSLTPRIERIEIDDVDGDAPQDAVDAKGRHTRFSLRLGVDYDKRDNVFFTTNGYRVHGALEAAGGDVKWVKEELEFRQWWTVWDPEGWGKHIVSMGAELGMMQSNGNGRVPMFDRYFIGGIGSLRGFTYRRIGPVDRPTGKQVGGENKLLFGGEYEFPVYRDFIRWVIFADAGTLQREAGDLLSDIRLAVGTGARLRLPFLGGQRIPISLYLAFPVVDETTDKTESFSFTVGTGFEF